MADPNAPSTDKAPFITYAQMREKNSKPIETTMVELTENFDDGSYTKVQVEVAHKEDGLSFLLSNTVPGFIQAGGKLRYEHGDWHDNFPTVLDVIWRSTWRGVCDDRPVGDRNLDTFKEDLDKFMQIETGDPKWSETFRNYLNHSSEHKLSKPKEVSPEDNTTIIRALITTFNSIPNIPNLTESEMRSCVYKSLPMEWRRDYSKTRDTVGPIHQVTQYMSDLFHAERRKKIHESVGSRQQNRKRSASQDAANPQGGSSSGVSNQRRRSDRGRSQSRGGGGRGRSNNRNYTNRRPNDNDPCPVHCRGMTREEASHTWSRCRLNDRGENYQGRGGNPQSNDSHYNQFHERQRNSAPNRGNGSGNASSAGNNRNASSNWQADEHYFDIVGLPSLQ
jgi:hypothetical protein